MAAGARPANPAMAPGNGLDPLRWAWNLLTNVKFALVLVGAACVAGMIGVLFPQLPAQMRSNPPARSAWMELQRGKYGEWTGTIEALGLFDVFQTAWFNGLWALIIVAVTVCTVSRFRPTWRSVHRPTRIVGDGYFDRARHSASFSHEGGPEAVEQLLRKRRYRVQRTKESGGAVYLFAERFSWSQYGTFVSHLALLMMLIGAMLTVFAGFDRTMVIAEETPAAAVLSPGPNQIFVRMVDAVRGLDDQANIIDYYSIVEVRRGAEAVTCKTSVNDPCRAFGYKVHQSAWFNDIARLRVTESASGQVLYDDIVDFDSKMTPTPVIKVTDSAGNMLFRQDLPQMATDPGPTASRGDDLAVALLTFPSTANGGRLAGYVVTWRAVDGALVVGLSGEGAPPMQLRGNEPAAVGPYRITYEGARFIPARTIVGFPGAIDEGGAATLQMPNDGDGRPYLFVTGIGEENAALTLDAPLDPGNGLTYTFGGQVEASGVSVRRDPGDTFIWVAVGMAVIGLAITFYIPRRRLWVKVSEGRTQMAGVAERTTRFSRELRLLGHDLGSRDALQPGDLSRGEG